MVKVKIHASSPDPHNSWFEETEVVMSYENWNLLEKIIWKFAEGGESE